MPSGSRLRMSLSRTNWSTDSVRRPTAASSAPSSSVIFCGGWALDVDGEIASAFLTITRMRPASRIPTASPPTAAAAPARPAPPNSSAVAWTACWLPSSLMNGRAR